MFRLDTHYSCAFSESTFEFIVKSLNDNDGHRETCIAFIDGDAMDIHSVLRTVYDYRKSNRTIYVITLLSAGKTCSAILQHLSDSVVDKKITVAALQGEITRLTNGKPKALSDNLYGDIMGELLKSSQREHQVLKLLIDGYSQTEIADLLHLSIKTVSGYKVKAVKRHGSRNFNTLFMAKFSHNVKNAV